MGRLEMFDANESEKVKRSVALDLFCRAKYCSIYIARVIIRHSALSGRTSL